MKRFFVALGKVALQICGVALPVVANSVGGPIGTVIRIVTNAVLKAEAQIGAGNGGSKAELALGMVEISAPAIIDSIEAATGKQLADDALFAEALKGLNDDVVKLLNAFRVLPKG